MISTGMGTSQIVALPSAENARPAALSGGVTAAPETMPYVKPRTMLSEPRVAMKGLSRMRVMASALSRPTAAPEANPAATAGATPAPATSTSAAIMPARPMVEPTARSRPPPIITIASPKPAMQIQEK